MNKTKVSIKLPIQPPRTTNQSGTRHTRTGITYKSETLKQIEQEYIYLLAKHRPRMQIVTPIKLYVEFGFKATAKKQIGKPHCSRPDIDNMLKTLIDCMTRCGYWHDDRQIYSLTAIKVIAEQPYIKIEVESEEQDGDR